MRKESLSKEFDMTFNNMNQFKLSGVKANLVAFKYFKKYRRNSKHLNVKSLKLPNWIQK